VAAALAEDHRVLAIDLPGFGYSTRRPEAGLSLGAHADRIAWFLDHLGIEAAAIIGHSMGGAIAQRFALQHPSRTDGLVLVAAVDASATEDWNGRHARRRNLLRAAMPIASVFPVVRPAVARALYDGVQHQSVITEEMVQGYLRPLQRPGTIRAVLRMAADTAAEAPACLEEIAAPTLVIAGEYDRVIGRHFTDRIASTIPGAQHVILEGTGHLPAEEKPDAFLAAVRPFLAQHLRAVSAA
jgi:pimeloyl-ACP methyl ester carboxylesterase